MTKDEVLVCIHALMTLESAMGMLSNSKNIPNSELMPILNMFSSVHEDLVNLYAENHAKKENAKKRDRTSESSRDNYNSSYESESMGEFFAHSTDFDGFGELWDARDWDTRGF